MEGGQGRRGSLKKSRWGEKDGRQGRQSGNQNEENFGCLSPLRAKLEKWLV